MDRFAFLAGLPRTGSTVLGALLSQHPSLHSTRTSCLRDLLDYVRKFSLGESLYYDITDPSSPAWAIMRGMLYGAYDHIAEEVVVEKNRMWVAEIPLIRKLTKTEPLILAPVRPITEIIASFILISHKNGFNSKIEDEIRQAGRISKPWTLSRIIWEKYIYADWKALKTAFESDPDCLLLIDYNDIVNKPKDTMTLIYKYLDVEPFTPSVTQLVNPSPEDDSVYGLKGLHEVRSSLSRTSPPAWEVLGDECYEFWNNQKLEFWEAG